MEKQRTIFTFYASSFNITKTKMHYINPENYGDDLAIWLAEEMKKLGADIIKDDEFPGQEDFGWYVNFKVGSNAYSFVVGARPDKESKIEWVGWIEKSCSFIASFFGGRNRNIGKDAQEIIHKALSSSDKISNIRWHYKEDFDKAIEETAATEP